MVSSTYHPLSFASSEPLIGRTEIFLEISLGLTRLNLTYAQLFAPEWNEENIVRPTVNLTTEINAFNKAFVGDSLSADRLNATLPPFYLLLYRKFSFLYDKYVVFLRRSRNRKKLLYTMNDQFHL